MKKSTNIKYPVILKGKAGYWHAYGKGWAVCAPTKEAVKQKYDEMLKLMNELISRPLNTSNDIL